jgi:hypothetical protein
MILEKMPELPEFFMLGQASDGIIDADQEREVCEAMKVTAVDFEAGSACFDNRDDAFAVAAELMRRHKTNIWVLGSKCGIYRSERTCPNDESEDGPVGG